jgi:flagellar protein FliS
MDIGGQPARALSEFYAAMYSQCVLASRDGSVELLEKTVANVRQVRDAWRSVTASETAQQMVPRNLQTREERSHAVPVAPVAVAPAPEDPPVSHRWSA